MNGFSKLAVAAVAVIAIGVVGLSFLAGRTPGPGSVASPTPSFVPSSAPTVVPTPAPTPPSQPTAPPLTGTYTSAIHGLSISYPANWTTVPATDPGPARVPTFGEPAVDKLHDPQLDDHLFIALYSEALDGQTGEAWATAVFDDPEEDCTAEREPITVDGAPGLICDTLALTWVGDRGYYVRLHVSPDVPRDREIYDRAWFDDVLATVQLPSGT